MTAEVPAPDSASASVSDSAPAAASVPVPVPTAFGTPAAPRVAVIGEARLDVDPEIARIGVTVSARGTDRRAALDDLTRRNAAALELIRSYGDAVEKVGTGAFAISPELTRSGRGERIRAYRGSVYLTAELGDFTELGELTTRLADLELTRVDGPWWALRPDSPAYGEARRAAVREAVQRARAYAEALGARLTALLELADQGAEHPVPYGAHDSVLRMAPAAVAGSLESAPALDLEPQRQTVQAQVTARFLMTPPQL